MGRRSLTKGKRGERDAAAEIRRLFGTEAVRGRQFSGSADSPDIRTGIPEVHFEVKRCEALQLYSAIEQEKTISHGWPSCHSINYSDWPF